MNFMTSQFNLRTTATALGVVAAVFWSAGSSSTLAQTTTNKPPVPDYRFVAQRNIFNPNRFPSSGGDRPRPSGQALARAPGFALVGTMIYEKGSFAFFDGTDAQYKKVIKNSGTIGDYQVAEIAAKYVTLQADTNRVTLPVGMQMKKLGETWELVAGTDAAIGGASTSGFSGGRDREYSNRRFGRRAAQDNSSSSEQTDSAPAPAPAPTGDVSDVMKRLMQQRERELQK